MISACRLSPYRHLISEATVHPLNFFVSYAVRIVSQEIRRLVLPRMCFTLILSKNLVKRADACPTHSLP
jgi:hypothetical protein